MNEVVGIYINSIIDFVQDKVDFDYKDTKRNIVKKSKANNNQ